MVKLTHFGSLKIQIHKDARQFRYKTLAHYDLLHEIFARTLATGAAASGTIDQLVPNRPTAILCQTRAVSVMNSPSDQLISTADISNLSPDSSDAELELQGHTQLKDDRIALSNSDDYKDYSNKREVCIF
jgi:hypothetical protein